MKLILYMATSINGKITVGQDDSDWVSETDWNEFDSLMKDCGVMIMGRRTYEIFGEDFPCEGALNIVMTNDKKLLKNDKYENALFTDLGPKEVLQMIKEKGYKKAMLIGGMNLNTSFIRENLVDEIWLSVHPFLIGTGLGLIDKLDIFLKLKRILVKELESDLIQIRYKVEN